MSLRQSYLIENTKLEEENKKLKKRVKRLIGVADKYERDTQYWKEKCQSLQKELAGVWCYEHNQVMWKNGQKCAGCLGEWSESEEEEESDSEDEEDFNEICFECDEKMSYTKLTEEECDEHPDREGGYISYKDISCEWYCVDCRKEAKEKYSKIKGYTFH